MGSDPHVDMPTQQRPDRVQLDHQADFALVKAAKSLGVCGSNPLSSPCLCWTVLLSSASCMVKSRFDRPWCITCESVQPLLGDARGTAIGKQIAQQRRFVMINAECDRPAVPLLIPHRILKPGLGH